MAVVRLYHSNTIAIMSHGQRSEALYEAQSMMETAITTGVSDASDTLSISFSSADGEKFDIEIPGATVTKTAPTKHANGKMVSITAFIPRKD